MDNIEKDTAAETAPQIEETPAPAERPKLQKHKWRFGDRKDGYKVRSLGPYNYISPYVMVERNDSTNMMRDSLDIENIEAYIREKKEQGYKTFGIMHVLLAAYVRLVSQKPRINRFINGQKIYAREEIQVNLAVKPEMNEDSVDTVVKMRFDHADTAIEVYEKCTGTIAKALSPDESSFDGTARILNYIPGLVKKFAFWLLKLLDYFGLLPKKLLDVSPFHGSMFITSMGSLGIPPIYHHLYNFGNVPVFISFGKKETRYVTQADGSAKKERYIDYTFVTDERICDGFYYASALRAFKRILNDPWVLDSPPEKIEHDVD